MKKIIFLISVSLLILISSTKTTAGTPSSGSLLGISISFSTRAYWAGPEQGCQPRERGWCLHISIDATAPVPGGTICGEISNLGTTGLMLSFNKKTGVTPETFTKFFKNGKFFIDGEGTMSEEIARKLGLAPSYSIPEGVYNYKETGDMVTITFKK